MYKEIIARTFDDITQTISRYLREGNQDILWFRGQRVSEWNIIPTLYRDNKLRGNLKSSYSNIHLMEDYRFHNFRAKTGHSIRANLQSKLEWQEVMQHHEVKTLLLDWTESATTALIFALEELIKTDGDNKKRLEMTPVLWLLHPKKLNREIYKLMTTSVWGRYKYIERAISFIAGIRTVSYAQRIGHELARNEDVYFSLDEYYSIDKLFNLSAIEEARSRNQGHLLESLMSFEFNPFHYMLLRYYADGITVDVDCSEPILPPLATVHQYHSARIEAQRGVFLVVPHYKLTQNAQRLYECGIDMRALDSHPRCDEYLQKIRLVDPAQIARDLIHIGERRSSVYPELSVYANDIEKRNTDYT